MSKLLDALKAKYSTPEDAVKALGLDPSLLAMDAAHDPRGADKSGSTTRNGAISMAALTSRRALVARGAILGYLRPVLAADAKFDPTPVLAGVNAKNFASKIPDIIAGVKTGTAGKLANDADPEDLKALLEALNGEEDGNDDLNPANPGMIDQTMDDANSPLHQFLASKLSPEDHAKAKQLTAEDRKRADDRRRADDMYRRRAEDARKRLGRDETEEEAEKREREEAAEDARKRLGRDESPEEKEKREKDEAEDRKRRRADDAKRKADDSKKADDRRRADDAPPDFKGMPSVGGKPMVTQQAMDEAIASSTKTAIENERANQRAIQAALREVRPYVGELDMAFDSAPDVFKKALEMTNFKDVASLHPSAYRPVLLAQPVPGSKLPHREGGNPAPLAMDSKNVVAFDKMFPGAKNVRNLA